MENNCALQLVNIVKEYGEGENAVKALKGVNLSFRKNEFVSVLGPSGCGKTTMLNIIGGLDRYTDGDLIISGISTKQYRDGDWDTYRNNRIGFVFQSYNLIPHQTVLKNVELALTLSGVSKAERKQRAEQALEKVGLKGQEHKRPNQLSGGQMQRVAIARALVNDPEIILADEPTGALDTETSIQVMDLLKEVALDRLVIMVTHNPELAKNYSTRTINLLDGKVVGDTRPFEGQKQPEKTDKKQKKHKTKKTSMSFFTAVALSMSNLRTKRGRTVLTSIAGSIGIIGIALVLAVSTGFSTYINKLQADTLSVYPLTITESTIDLSDFEKLANKEITDEKLNQRVKQTVYERQMFGDLTNMLKSNILSPEYVKFVEDFAVEQNEKAKDTADKWEYCVQKSYGFDVNNYIFTNLKCNLSGDPEAKPAVTSIDSVVKILEGAFNVGLSTSNMNISAEFVRAYIPTVSEIPANQHLIESQYDKLYGDWALKEDELMLVVDKYNQLSDITLALLGYRTIESMNYQQFGVTFGGDAEFSFEDACNRKFYFIDNDTRYESTGDHTYKAKTFDESDMPENAKELKIVGVVRKKDDIQQGVLQEGIAYTSKFVDYIMETNKESEIVKDAREGYSSVNPLTGLEETKNTVKVNGIETTIRQLSGSVDPSVREISQIAIYSVGYEAKEKMKEHLDKWNEPFQQIIDREEAKPENEQNKDLITENSEKIVHYSDSTAMLFFALNSIVDAVKIVLICFTGISLVVSSIMIGIITYVSVVERTKEIGVLRSLGARKKDISRIFNAETFLIGLFAGLIGVGVSYLLTIPINAIVGGLIENVGNLAILKITDALILVIVSFILTLIAGIIPARIASKKDPVIALRTE